MPCEEPKPYHVIPQALRPADHSLKPWNSEDLNEQNVRYSARSQREARERRLKVTLHQTGELFRSAGQGNRYGLDLASG